MSSVLTVEVPDKASEVSIFDGRFEKVASGVGGLVQTLEPGLYKVRVRVGPSVDERLVSLGQDQTVSFGAATISSEAPLSGTSKTRDYHEQAAVEASVKVMDTFGEGGSLLVFARVWTQAGDGANRPGNPAEGLSLLRDNGDFLQDIGSRADVRTKGDPCAGWRANLAPGPFRLRLRLSDGTSIERALFVGRDQQTQIFLLDAEHALVDGGTDRKADLAGGTVMIFGQQRFSPDSMDARCGELTRYALTQGRRILSDPLVDRLLAPDACPVFGLFGAHLLLRDRPQDRDSFEKLLAKLTRRLGNDNPDVQALALRGVAAPSGADAGLSAPPMLRASWDLAVAASGTNGALFAPRFADDEIAMNVKPTAPWLTWAADLSADAVKERADMLLDVLGSYVNARTRVLVKTQQLAGRKIIDKLDRLDSLVRKAEDFAGEAGTLISNVLHGHLQARVPGPELKVGAPEGAGLENVRDIAATALSILGGDEKASLSRSLGIPAATLDDLLRKLRP